MEVHHHPKLHHSRRPKAWKEYLFEFLMIFLAVTLGFFAENIRQRNEEKKQALAYIKSFWQDVQKDTTNLNITIASFDQSIKQLNALLDSFGGITSKNYPHLLLDNIKALYYYEDFVYTDRTIEQLKNAGGLRLIDDNATADSIISYDGIIRYQQIQEKEVLLVQHELQNFQRGILDLKKLVPALTNPRNKDLIKGDWLLTYDKKNLEFISIQFLTIQGFVVFI